MRALALLLAVAVCCGAPPPSEPPAVFLMTCDPACRYGLQCEASARYARYLQCFVPEAEALKTDEGRMAVAVSLSIGHMLTDRPGMDYEKAYQQVLPNIPRTAQDLAGSCHAAAAGIREPWSCTVILN